MKTLSDNAIRRWLKQFQATGSVAAIETVTPQMLENTWRETDILRAMKVVHVEVV
jgi:hypothetical protein